MLEIRVFSGLACKVSFVFPGWSRGKKSRYRIFNCFFWKILGRRFMLFAVVFYRKFLGSFGILGFFFTDSKLEGLGDTLKKV